MEKSFPEDFFFEWGAGDPEVYKSVGKVIIIIKGSWSSKKSAYQLANHNEDDDHDYDDDDDDDNAPTLPYHTRYTESACYA